MENQKSEIRRSYKKKREDMSAEQVMARSGAICAHILSSAAFCGADWIFAYYPLGNEVDVRSVVREAWRQGKRVAFPKVYGEKMRFFEAHDFSELHPGTFGVMEPEGDADGDGNSAQDAKETTMRNGNYFSPVQREQKPAAVKALMLVPGVAFDREGNRMGFGKGYYDRYLMAWRKDCGLPMTTMGVAYELQVAERIPTEETDVPLDYLVTEKGRKDFDKANAGE